MTDFWDEGDKEGAPYTLADGKVEGVTLYATCEHSRWARLWDRLRRREHPEQHPILHSAMYSAFTDSILENSGAVDLDADTIRVVFHADGTFRLEDDHE